MGAAERRARRIQARQNLSQMSVHIRLIMHNAQCSMLNDMSDNGSCALGLAAYVHASIWSS